MKDHEHPFFRPLWRRIAIIAVCAGWSVFEFWNGSSMWGWIAAAFTAYAVWQFLYLYKPIEEAQPAEASADTPPESPPAQKE
ncbi:MAG: DUF3329 domain-containing protein [Mesorhizobium sp.]|nr:DUF3329 domain-containing protein [Mesorhizobium sp.]MBL8576798.1 DUF3329 domain-containing protein [Mesorhizobium sp.]